MAEDQENRQRENQNSGRSRGTANIGHNYSQGDPENWYSEEVKRTDNRSWEEYRRSVDHSRDLEIN